MPGLQKLQALGQSVWLDNISRELLTSGTLQRYIRDFAVTGLTSNPTIFYKALKDGESYDASIRRCLDAGLTGEELFFRLAIEDIVAAADLFAPAHARTSSVDGWVSLEVSPTLAYDAKATVAEAERLFARAARPNVFIKIPGTRAGLSAIEESIFRGVPINVTLLFSYQQYEATADAWLRGIERRIEAGLDPDIASVASVFISRWDVAVHDRTPAPMRNTLGIAVGQRCYRAYREFLASRRLARVMNYGARPQRLLFASTGTKDPAASDVLYVDALAAPLTINTIPESTLAAYADHGSAQGALWADFGNADAVMAAHEEAGVDIDDLAEQLQKEGAQSFVKSWDDLLAVVAAKSASLSSLV
ncbi:MAG TPA: transaldolase [Woeseiaceae bacterium]|nr:transaldolase [Woeseiaceae bacterium]